MDLKDHEGASIRQSIEALRDHAKSYSFEDLTSGAWLARFLTYALKDYSQRTDEATLRSRYPGLPTDEIAARTIERTRRRAAIEGALTATAHTAAVGITLGAGWASMPLTLPVGLAAFAADMFYRSMLQLRLAYDMSLLYGRELDLDDSEDVLDLIRVAFGVKAVDNQLVMEKGLGLRLMKSLADGTAKVTRTVLTSVGKSAFRQAVVKFTLPAASIPLAAGMNYYFTGETAELARQVFRDKTAIRHAAQRLAQAGASDPRLILQIIWLVARADRKPAAEECWLLESTVAAFSRTDASAEAAGALDSLNEATTKEMVRLLTRSPRVLREAAFEAACVTAIVDHELSRRERRVLTRLANACGSDLDLADLRRRARNKDLW
jgi:uncharacterized protein (DUF697 family)